MCVSWRSYEYRAIASSKWRRDSQEFALPERRYAQDVFALDRKDWILVALTCGEQRDPVLPRVCKLKPQKGVHCQPPKDGWADGSPELDAEISSPGVVEGAPTTRGTEHDRELEFLFVAAGTLGRQPSEVERVGERLGGLAVREHTEGELGSAPIIRNRPRRSRPRANAPREPGCAPAFPLRGPRAPRPPLDAGACAHRREWWNDGPLDQHVLESILRLGPAPIRDDEAEPLELVKRFWQGELRPYELRKEREVELAADH